MQQTVTVRLAHTCDKFKTAELKLGYVLHEEGRDPKGGQMEHRGVCEQLQLKKLRQHAHQLL